LESSASAGHVTSAVLDPRRWWALALICGALFMALLAGTITIAALPSIGAGLRFSEQGWRWVLSAYALTFGGLLRLGGRAADLLTARHPASRLYDRGLSHVGLRVTGYSVLSRLAAEKPMPVGDLARWLAMERTTCTREVAPLVRSGLVEAAVGPDRRQRILRLTSLGEQKRADAYSIWERAAGGRGRVRRRRGPRTADTTASAHRR
jgi:DNA-binding MarR family transcriptional regulator